MPLSSLKNSRNASTVLSVCTPDDAKKGQGDDRMSNVEPAPWE